MPAIQDPRTAKEPRTPTAGRMKNRPGAAVPSGGALLSRAGCRGTYPPPAAGCMVTAFALDQKSTGVLPMLYGYSIPQVFSGFLWSIHPPRGDAAAGPSADPGQGLPRSAPTAGQGCTDA